MVNNNLGYSYCTQQMTAPNYQQSYCNSQQQPNNFYQNNQQNQQVTNPIPAPRIIDYVQGELGATIYPVAYGQEAILLDMDDPNRLYRKSRDINGKVTPLEKCKIVQDEDTKSSEINLKEYVKVDDIFDIVSEAVQNEVEKKLSEISFKPTASENKFLKKGDKS